MASDLVLRLDHFLNALPTIATRPELADAVTTVSAPLGLPTVMAGTVLVRGDKVVKGFQFGNWPSTWTQEYIESVMAVDPVVHAARRRMSPFTWTELFATGELSRKTIRDLMAAVEGYGWYDGLAVPIHGPGGYVGLVAFAGGRIDLSPLDRSLLVALSHAAHQHARKLFTIDVALPKLTGRELHVMRWVGRGKTDTEIASILDLSVATVHSYVEQAKRKLGAHSRSQAVNELLMHELIQ